MDDSFLFLFNAQPIEQLFHIPATIRGRPWTLLLDTAHPMGLGFEAPRQPPEQGVHLTCFSLVVLRSPVRLGGRH
ncbi:MAG: hypothetical protein ACKO4L_06305 [Nodosilinea sp.]